MMMFLLATTMMLLLLLLLASFLALKKAKSIARGACDDAQKAWGSPFRPITLVLPSPSAIGGGEDYLYALSGSKATVINFSASSTATQLTFSGCCKRGPGRDINKDAIDRAVFIEAGVCLPAPSPGCNTPTTMDFCRDPADLGACLLSAITPLVYCWTHIGGDNASFDIGIFFGKTGVHSLYYPASRLQVTTALLLSGAGRPHLTSRRLAALTLSGHTMCTPAVPPTKSVVVPFLITKRKDADLKIIFGVCFLVVRARIVSGSRRMSTAWSPRALAPAAKSQEGMGYFNPPRFTAAAVRDSGGRKHYLISTDPVARSWEGRAEPNRRYISSAYSESPSLSAGLPSRQAGHLRVLWRAAALSTPPVPCPSKKLETTVTDKGSGGPVAVVVWTLGQRPTAVTADTLCSRSPPSTFPGEIWPSRPQISSRRCYSSPPIRRVTSRSPQTSSRNRTSEFPTLGMEHVSPVSSSSRVTQLKVFPPASSQSSRLASEKYRLTQPRKRSDSSSWSKRLGAIFQGRSTKRPSHSLRVVRMVVPS